MQILSPQTVSTAADIAKSECSEGNLEILFMQAGPGQYMPRDWYGKAKLVALTIRGALAAAARDPRTAEGLKEFVRLVAEMAAPADPEGITPGTPFWRLRDAVRACGFDLHAAYETTGEHGGWEPVRRRLTGVRILPLDHPLAPLSTEITVLESDFERLGMSVALNVYRQAVDCLTDQRFEAANSQLRALLEEVVVHLAVCRGASTPRQARREPIRRRVEPTRRDRQLCDAHGGVTGHVVRFHGYGPAERSGQLAESRLRSCPREADCGSERGPRDW
ncbi:hypothetical protein ACWC5I_02630 [Kitasatospora sp. NPDC001574]